MIYEPEAALADAMEDLAEKDLLIADLRARLAEVKILADSYCANCAPDSIQAQVAERFRAAARGEDDRPAGPAHPFRRPTHGRVLADFDKCGAVAGGKRCWRQSSDPIHSGEGDRG